MILLVPRTERSSRFVLFTRPLVLLPVLAWGAVYGCAAQAVLAVSFWAIVLLGRHPRGMWTFLERFLRFVARVNAYAQFLTDEWPPFRGREDGDHPVRVSVEYPATMSRAHTFFRGLLVLPHMAFAAGYGIAAAAVAALAAWSILLLGRIPDALFPFLRRHAVYSVRVTAYALLLVDEYPPFHGEQPLAAHARFGGGA